MDWQLIFQWSFLVSIILAAIRLAVPVALATLGEVVTERAGILNLGLEGIMVMGASVGFLTSYFLENTAFGAAVGTSWTSWLGLLAGMAAGMGMGLIMSLLSITLRADQTISGVTLVVLGLGLSAYIYRQAFSSLTARVAGMEVVPIPILREIPFFGLILFNHNPPVYLTVLIGLLVWFLLYRTTWGLKVRAVGENPAAAETSGINVAFIRYSATLFGSALAGLGGAVLTVVQLQLFRDGITAGRGWIAVALVIFARWRPGLALLGSLLFGLADALQYRIQTLSQIERGAGAVPYEFLLMIPYILTILSLLYRKERSDTPAALGEPYFKGK